jgi:DNA-binding response OmpR family regulator
MTRILIIEPEVHVRHALRNILEGAGYDVDVASDGSDGADCYRSHPADLVIADVEDVAQRRETFSGVRFIAVPSHSVAKPAPAGVAVAGLGATRVLPKPFGRDTLLAVVRSTLADAPTLSQ